ncbi:MAG: PrsW family glutamic-type intramembrane protease [Candidatus Latescibacterota bacterium]|jgi:RsiW-degrading membrane proteinase PrsW (M82 family)/Tfp pilus assembly protein PilF
MRLASHCGFAFAVTASLLWILGGAAASFAVMPRGSVGGAQSPVASAVTAMGRAAATGASYEQLEASLEQERYEQTLPVLERLVRQYPDDTQYHRWYQDCLQALGRGEEVERVYRARLHAAPYQASNWYLLGRLLNDDPEAAARHFERAIALDPGYPWGYYGLGMQFREWSQEARALPLLVKAAGLGLNYPPVHLQVAECQTELGAPEEAIREYRAFLAERPGDIARPLVEHRLEWLGGDNRTVVLLPLLGLISTILWTVGIRRWLRSGTPLGWGSAALLVGAGALVAAPLLCEGLYLLYSQPLRHLGGLHPLAPRFVRNLLFVGPIEETAKWLAAMIVVFRLRLVRTPLEGVTCGALVGLGFSWAENVMYMWNLGVEATAARLVTCVFVHVALSSVWGYGLGRARQARSPARGVAVIMVSLAGAAVLHGLYNGAVELSDWNQAVDGPSWMGLVVFAALVDLAIVFCWLVRRARMVQMPRVAMAPAARVSAR